MIQLFHSYFQKNKWKYMFKKKVCKNVHSGFIHKQSQTKDARTQEGRMVPSFSLRKDGFVMKFIHPWIHSRKTYKQRNHHNRSCGDQWVHLQMAKQQEGVINMNHNQNSYEGIFWSWEKGGRRKYTFVTESFCNI